MNNKYEIITDFLDEKNNCFYIKGQHIVLPEADALVLLQLGKIKSVTDYETKPVTNYKTK